MCIIAIKPQGAKLPTEDTLKTMFTRNPDGAGFMFPMNGRVEIRKGFMTYEGFKQALDNVVTHIGEDAPIVMHFRITTHGGTSPQNCHPFPLTKKVGEMKQLSCSASVGVAHNGIINIKTRATDISDTMEYISSVLAPVYRRNKKFWKTQRILNGIADTINGSRLAILTGAGEVIRIGKWVQDGDLWYSNDGFKPYDYSRWSYLWDADVDDYYESYYGKDYKNYKPTASANDVRKPWEGKSMLYTKLMPLEKDDIVEDDDGDLWWGEYYAIDSRHRVYEIDIDDCTARLTTSHTYSYVQYDKRKAIYFELAA